VLPWVIPLMILFIWQLTTAYNLVRANILPEPLQVAETFVKLLRNGDLLRYVGSSSQRALSGFLIGGGIGFVLGLLTGLSIWSERLLDSSIQMLRTIPHLALIPLVILWFGIGEETKLVLVSLGVFFPIYINTFHGIKSIDPELMEMGRVYGLKGFALFRDVVLPGALPTILVGVRYALGVMWLTLIVAETVAADSGIGYMASQAREFMQMDVIVLSLIVYAALGKLSDLIAKLMEYHFLKWRLATNKKETRGQLSHVIEKKRRTASNT
ncbi:MAG: ABC transporter permease subunit, partial [Gorillibacterium sp.]|nr:ABC transporter permease subunit [Gorillibacterium sp.]